MNNRLNDFTHPMCFPIVSQPLAFDFLRIFSFGYPRLTQVAHKWLSFEVFTNPMNLSSKGTNPPPRAPSFGSQRFTS